MVTGSRRTILELLKRQGPRDAQSLAEQLEVSAMAVRQHLYDLQENGFEVETTDLSDLRMIKSMSGIKPELASCHTAKVGGYVIEGHVPADDIKRLLTERPVHPSCSAIR